MTSSDKEIAIRISSPMPFIDDEDEEDNKEQQQKKDHKKVQYNLKITDDYQSKTRNIEISKELQQVEFSNGLEMVPDKRLAPIGAVVDEDGKPSFEMVIHDPATTEKQSGMRLVIRGSKSVISIDSFEGEETKKEEQSDIVDLLNAEIGKIFKKPDRGEIEKVVKQVLKSDKPKAVCRFFKSKPKMKKGNWKLLTKSFMSMKGRQDRRGSDERYPKMVLLNDPKEEIKKQKEENNPKKITLDKKPPKLNEIAIEQHVIDLEKKHLEKEKTNLYDERKELQVERKEIEKEKNELKKEKKYLNQEQHILDEKKHIIREEKSLLCDRKTEGFGTKLLEKELNILGEEKLCIEIEKQLLNEEKHMLEEEKDILKKEKDMLEKERCILGEEKNVLEEEKTLLVKEKSVLERQKSFLEETGFPDRCEDDERTGESEANGSDEDSSEKETSESTEVEQYRSKKNKKLFNEIQEVLQDTLKMYPKPEDQPPCPPCLPPPDVGHNYHNPYYDPYYYHYPSVYVPVYNPPYYRCCGARTQNSTTQTSVQKTSSESQTQFPEQEVKEEVKEDDVDLPGLPFGLLSSFFPRVVIMKTMRTEEENASDETNAKGKIVELGKEAICEQQENDNATSPISSRRNEDEENEEDAGCSLPRIVVNESCNLLKIPTPDLSIKAKNISKVGNSTESEETEETEETETEESGINTGCNSDDICLKGAEDACLAIKETLHHDTPSVDFWDKDNSDESLSIEKLHFGDGEIFENESIRPEKSWGKKLKLSEESGPDDQKSPKQMEKERVTKTSDLPLTKIGYQIYDKLTKLSLDREKSPTREKETQNGTKTPCNIRLDINQKTIQVTVPEEQVNLEISSANSRKGLKIGLSEEGKNIVRKNELWHVEAPKKHESKNLEIRVEEKVSEPQEISVSLSDDRKIVLSINMDRQALKEVREIHKKMTHEVRVGTDDLEVAGGDFDPNPGTSRRNLSPRTGKLLQSLEEKLESVERKAKPSILKTEPKREAFDWRKRQLTLPGIFLVKQISPKDRLKPMVETGKRAASNSKSAREYYCEECLATMRLLDDECLSVKNMVDKFETIIQLGSY